ncbi:recombinase family protein [Kitasatospora sp. NPDC094019]|uniref:recombinase family protein n=1 Tax=Kitasatospora sp. NPDC094019 TaxID=3364091 RepID=UPI0037F25F8F
MAPRVFGFADASKQTLLESEAQAVREIVDQRIGGAPRALCAAYLREHGFVGTLGGQFTSSIVARLLRNPAIAGLRTDPSGGLVDAGHPGMITPVQFAQLQAQDEAEAKRNDDGTPAEPVPDYDYLFGSTDLVVCGLCGASLQGLRTNAGYPGYTCPDGPRVDRPGTCGRVRISAPLLEDFMGTHIVARLLLPGSMKALEEARDEAGRLLAEYEEKLKTRREGVDELAGMVLRREVTAKSAALAKTEAQREIKLLKKAVRRLQKAADTPVLGTVEELVDWWNIAPTESKAGLALLMLHRVDIHPAGRGTRSIKPGRVTLWWRNQPPPPPLRAA